MQRGSESKSRKVSSGSPGDPPAGDAQSETKPRTSFNPLGSPFRPLGKSSIRLFSWGDDPLVQDAVIKVALYLQVEREHYYPLGKTLSDGQKNALAGFYSPQLLDQVRIVELKGERVENPWFYEEAKARGITNLPDIGHKAAVTFLDVVVFNEDITARDLFHGLVHVAQAKILGRDRFAQLFVTGFLQARSYFLVPLKAHAFALDTRYSENPEAPFSVEQEVMRWAAEDRY